MICEFCRGHAEKHTPGWVQYSFSLTACGRNFYMDVHCCEKCDHKHQEYGGSDGMLVLDSFHVYDLV